MNPPPPVSGAQHRPRRALHYADKYFGLSRLLPFICKYILVLISNNVLSVRFLFHV